MIEASFAGQYHIRLRSEENMSWGEFTTLLNGLSAESPLGQLVRIRREDDKDMLKHFSSDQKRIRNEWRLRQAEKANQDTDFSQNAVSEFEKLCKNSFGKAEAYC